MKSRIAAAILFAGLVCVISAGCSFQGRAEKAGYETRGTVPASAASPPVQCPLPSEMKLDDAMALRRSTRSFADKPLTEQQLLALAWAGQGITEPNRGFRTAPSAGAKYPIELYLVTPDGVYRYNPGGNSLEKQLNGDKRAALSAAAVNQSAVADAGVDFVVAGVVERTRAKYGDRAERYVLIEVGHVGQNILLKAVAMGLCGVPMGAFYDDKVAELLALPDGYHPYYILSIGHPENEMVAAAPVEWIKPRFDERRDDRDEMVDTQMSSWFAVPAVKDKAVLDALRHVPRHLFVPSYLSSRAYADGPLPIGHGQTISQPYIVGLMTQLLELEPGGSVLEIGTGSGYQAAILSEITPHVYSIEIIEALGDGAAERLKDLGYSTVKVRVADGYLGWEEYAPFDAIIVTCAAGHIPPPLLEQLKPGGRMIIPIGGQFEPQRLVVVTKDEGGQVTTRDHIPVRFVPMLGRAEEG